MSKAYWLAKGYWKSYPAEYISQAQANIDQGKMERQALHRTTTEQSTCVTCGHARDKHFTGTGVVTPCKVGGPAAPCACGPFIGSYSKKRTTLGKPTTNPLEGATSAISTYVIMNKVPKDLETVVTSAIIAAEGGAWAASRPSTRGIKVSAKNVTTDPTQPTYQVFHYVGVI